MEKLNEGLKKFIDGTPNAFYCVDNIKKELISNGFIELNENESWDHLEANNNYFVIRNDSSIIAFKLPDQKENIGFNIVTSHGDSPSYKIKNNPEMFDGNYLKLNTSKYGSMIHYSWLDRPLSLSGRVITYSDGRFNKELVNIDKDLLIIPSQALHINLEANTKNELNPQTDMLPVISLNADFSLDNTLKENLEAKGSKFERICDYDLYLYNRDKLIDAGLNDEFIMALRLDDLASVYPSLHAFIN